MTIFAFTAGSLGDILATIGLTAQVVQVLYDHRNITQECNALAMELRSLQQVLISTDVALQKYESTPLGAPLVDFIRPEVAQCHLLLQQFSHKVESCRQAWTSTTISTLWRRVVWAASDEAVSLSAKLSGHRLKLALLLMSLNSVGFLDPGKSRITEAQLFKQSGPFSLKRIKNNTIDVVDPLGDTIPVSTLFCSAWESFHYVINGYSFNRIGQAYVERGDYLIVRPENNQTVDRSSFAKAVKDGDVFEMSIILKSQSETRGQCPRCSHSNSYSPSEGGWIRCFRCSCCFNVDHTTKVNFLWDEDGFSSEDLSSDRVDFSSDEGEVDNTETNLNTMYCPHAPEYLSKSKVIYQTQNIFVVSLLHTTPRACPPPWLASALTVMQAKYPFHKFEILLHKSKVTLRQPEWRIKCLDCPGKLYILGPGKTLSNYDVHMQNHDHCQHVNDRLYAAVASAKNPSNTSPPPWLANAVKDKRARYPKHKFELIFRKFKWRMKCLDCPGKLYTPGPGETLWNFDVHLENRLHNQRVNDRLAAAAATPSAEGPTDAKS